MQDKDFAENITDSYVCSFKIPVKVQPSTEGSTAIAVDSATEAVTSLNTRQSSYNNPNFVTPTAQESRQYTTQREIAIQLTLTPKVKKTITPRELPRNSPTIR
ncbi:hypothetical protein LX36DRAFT_301200 [Colletotrichum falcatum]|nr:hypothetical protein LX36DRAFT_301200 [Colletotrichum falcatum]